MPEGVAQIEVEPRVTSKALQIVEDDDEALVRLSIEKGEKRLHAGALHEVTAAADRVRENGGDFIAF
ncbi:hypothetical protein MF134_18255 [Jiella sp. LLJ827]|nr:hypothetical protein [Jiella sp. LLJ827]MCQ0989594.1 hypothetical protein [Jiella sp. LLJ827]